MTAQKIEINRTLVGVLAASCLGAAITIFVGYSHNESLIVWQAAFTRVGLVLTALWLALPTRGRPAAWSNVSPSTLFGLLLALLACARYPKVMIPVLIVVAIIGFFLKPRPRGRRSPDSHHRDS